MHGHDTAAHTSPPAMSAETATQSGETQPPQLHLDSMVSQACLTITDQYHSGSILKTATILELQDQLDSSDDYFEDSLGLYIQILDNFEVMMPPLEECSEPRQTLHQVMRMREVTTQH